MKGIDKEFDFGVLFHQHYSMQYRKELFSKYSRLFNVKLYHIVSGFHFPKLVEDPKVTE
jgi:hypothetical protein